ncbi:MAG: hypothetical protein U0892_06365 [Pirellulales bacterium]
MSDSSPNKWFKLEEAFFHGVDEQLLQNLRRENELKDRAEAIRRITGLTDDKVAAAIAALDISVESLAAIRLIPLVAVAWADDRVDENESFRILKAAENAQIIEGEPSYELLKRWLGTRPPADLLDTWVEYAKSLAVSLDGESKTNLRKSVTAQAKAVASASGGVLGVGSISPSEKAVLERIEAALS